MLRGSANLDGAVRIDRMIRRGDSVEHAAARAATNCADAGLSGVGLVLSVVPRSSLTMRPVGCLGQGMAINPDRSTGFNVPDRGTAAR